MEEIKGKLHNHGTTIHIQYEENGKVLNHTCVANANSAIAEAELFATEIPRRWNAFEKDGLVDELKAACEAQEESDNWCRKLKDKAKKLRVAAIAKVKA